MTVVPRTVRRVVIVDDSRTIQAMLDNVFSKRNDFRVVGIAGDAQSAAEMVKRLMPDLVTIDLCMPYIDGATLLEMIAGLHGVCKVIVSDQSVRSILMTSKLTELGASACLGKRELADDPDAFFRKINAACDIVEAARKNRFGPIGNAVPRDSPTLAPSTPIAHFGFPVPVDEALRLDLLRRKHLANATRERQFDLATGHLAQMTAFPVCLLTFIDEDTQWIKSSHGFDRTRMPRAHGFCNYTISQGGTFVVANAVTDPRFAQNPLVTGAPYIRAYAGHPITTREEVRVGALCLIDVKPRSVSNGVIRQLTGIAALLGEMIDHRAAPTA